MRTSWSFRLFFLYFLRKILKIDFEISVCLNYCLPKIIAWLLAHTFFPNLNSSFRKARAYSLIFKPAPILLNGLRLNVPPLKIQLLRTVQNQARFIEKTKTSDLYQILCCRVKISPRLWVEIKSQGAPILETPILNTVETA